MVEGIRLHGPHDGDVIRDGREVIAYLDAKIGSAQRAAANTAAKVAKAVKPAKVVKAVKPAKQVKVWSIQDKNLAHG